tara:strand:+ start:2384 stop:3280 length:897 start_codon:yes stop_codon:yes gene_type:complete
MKNTLLFLGLAFCFTAFGQTLYEEGFENFAAGDFVTDSPVWIPWVTGQEGTEGDAQISSDFANTGFNSLHIFSTSAAGGPLDVVMLVGLDEGVYTASWMMYVTDGNSAYYNVQEDQAPGIGWAFDVTFAFTGDLQVVMDGETVGSGSFPIGEWFEVRHDLDLDNDVVTLTVAGTEVGSFMFDSLFGGVNFFGYGDGTTIGNYYVDDINLSVPANISELSDDIVFNFGPNPASTYVNLKGQPNNAMIRIHALNGQLVHEQIVNNMNRGETIELDLNNGIYFLEVNAGERRSTQRLVVQR